MGENIVAVSWKTLLVGLRTWLRKWLIESSTITQEISPIDACDEQKCQVIILRKRHEAYLLHRTKQEK